MYRTNCFLKSRGFSFFSNKIKSIRRDGKGVSESISLAAMQVICRLALEHKINTLKKNVPVACTVCSENRFSNDNNNA
jgi:hypothetical protein